MRPRERRTRSPGSGSSTSARDRIGFGGMDEQTPVGNLKLERIVLLVDSPEAQRLVATWYMAWERYADQLDNSTDTGDELSADFRTSWARIARCDIDDV